MMPDSYLDQVVASERQLVDLFEPLLEMLRTFAEEHHVLRSPDRELVYWQTRPIMIDEDGDLRIVTVRTIPVTPDRDLNNPLHRVEFFEKRELQVDVEGMHGPLKRLLIGSWGDGAVSYVFDGTSGRAVPFTRRDFHYYLELAAKTAAVLESG
jgi:hypothetical protein